MFRRKEKPINIESWEEVDTFLKEIGECEISINEIEASMNLQINDIKEKSAKMSKPVIKRMKVLEKAIKEFVDYNKADMEGKSRDLNFGKVGYRQSTQVSVPRKNIELVLENLKKFNMSNCINIKESINRDVLSAYPEEDIIKVGASKKVKDTFYLKTDLEKIRSI